LVLLIWSADRFIDGASATAKHLGMPPLLIGMVIIGFGTSAPEMVVSALAAMQGNPGLALGNAYGSNIANISLILGLVALISPIAVHSGILRKELPILLGVTALGGLQLLDGEISRTDAVVLLLVFAGLMGWTIWQGLRSKGDVLGDEVAAELASHPMALNRAIIWLVLGLILLIISSRILVWGAVDLASGLGISDLVIGLTIVAVGTSLPELASSIIAVRKGEHDLALGNIIGSNLFNTLAVVGIAGAIQPMAAGPEVLWRDWMVMAGLTLALFVFSFGFRGPGRLNRIEGGTLLAAFVAYMGFLAFSVMAA
ncbi:MAG TPA: calcium/sodium antiporter, partial [Chromatiales bacterium]|nr:calcium/sodium antiporter [Chromatiales bacterium]